MNVCRSVNYGFMEWILQKGHKKIEMYVHGEESEGGQYEEYIKREEKRKEKKNRNYYRFTLVLTSSRGF